MDPMLILVIIIIFLALVFDFTNGFHDSANAIATVVSTKVLTPRQAVGFAAFFNFIAAFGFGVAVAVTMSKIIHLNLVAVDLVPYIILGGLIGAISWNLITWYLGLPTSSSHALIGGIMGSGISAAGFAVIKYETVELAATSCLSPHSLDLSLDFSSWSLFSGYAEKPQSQRSTNISKNFNCFPRVSTASVMEQMMRKKRWGLLPLCCSVSATLVHQSTRITSQFRSGSFYPHMLP